MGKGKGAGNRCMSLFSASMKIAALIAKSVNKKGIIKKPHVIWFYTNLYDYIMRLVTFPHDTEKGYFSHRFSNWCEVCHKCALFRRMDLLHT